MRKKRQWNKYRESVNVPMILLWVFCIAAPLMGWYEYYKINSVHSEKQKTEVVTNVIIDGTDWNASVNYIKKNRIISTCSISIRRLLVYWLWTPNQAREIIRIVGLETQQQLQYHISDITSLALDAVFEDPYQLKVDFVQRRNKTECDLLFLRNEKEIDPLESSGYGAVDIASFALRVASWSLKNQKSRPVIILDEPMRFLSQDRQTFASNMIKELSEKLNIQFIIVTHEEVLTEYADKIFFVSQRRIGKWKKSKIIES